MAEDLYQYIGNKIRACRGKMSQEELAKRVGTKANTISRWETGVYHPTAADLDKLSRILGIGVWAFFPGNVNPPVEAQGALLSATGDLPQEDLEELQRYAEFIRTRRLLQEEKKRQSKIRKRG